METMDDRLERLERRVVDLERACETRVGALERRMDERRQEPGAAMLRDVRHLVWSALVWIPEGSSPVPEAVLAIVRRNLNEADARLESLGVER